MRRINLSNTRAKFHDIPNAHANNITGLWPTMEKCYQLMDLEIGGNFIKGLPELHKNGATLRTLSASRNIIRNFPPELKEFTALETLGVFGGAVGVVVLVPVCPKLGLVRGRISCFARN